jgi:putative ABC transport system substrate-binding protein
VHAWVDAFKEGLAGLGWSEDRNLRFEERWTDNAAGLDLNAMELARLAPDAIFVTGSPSLRAMRRASVNIPIVFGSVADPVEQGFVSSLAHPGANITGFAVVEFGFAPKQLDLLKKLAPKLERITDLYDPANPAWAGDWGEVEAAAPLLALGALKVPVRDAEDIERAIEALAREPNSGLYVTTTPATIRYRELIAALALRHRLPAVYRFRFHVESGGLVSYGPDLIDQCRRAASYVDRILRGEKASDLPVQLPTRFELVLNLKTAKALGLTIPETLLATADEVIQ